jgi:hypothetical protein
LETLEGGAESASANEVGVRRLSEDNLYSSNLPQSNPRGWADQVIAQNWGLMDEAMPWWEERDILPEEAETFGEQ